jgi:hypothetical protein
MAGIGATSPFVQASPNDRSPTKRTIKLTSLGSALRSQERASISGNSSSVQSQPLSSSSKLRRMVVSVAF